MESDTQAIAEYLSGRFSASGSSIPVFFDVGTIGWMHSPRPRPAERQPVLVVRAGGSSILVGPFDTGSGPCGTCLEKRWLDLHSDEECETLHKWNLCGPPSGGTHPALSPFQLESVWRIAQVLMGLTSQAPPRFPQGAPVFMLDLRSQLVTLCGLVPDSHCPQCEHPPVKSFQPGEWPFPPSEPPKSGNCRLRKLSDMDLSELSYTNPLCGALGGISYRDYTNPVTAPVSGKLRYTSDVARFALDWGGHSNTYRDSMKVGLIEGMERRAGAAPRRRTDEIFDSYRNLGQDALDPRDCGIYEPEMFEHPEIYWVPFDEDLKVHWVWGYSLTEKRPILLPEQLVYYCNHTNREPLFVHECSNGCATGSSLEEAALYGLIELMERDAFLISWFARLSLPKLDCHAVESREFQLVCDRIRRFGYEVSLFDMRLDFPIPLVMAVAKRRETGLGMMSLAAGGSFDPSSAIWGAVCEMATYLGSLEKSVRAREDELRAMSRDFRRLTKIFEHTLLFGLPEMFPYAEFLWGNAKITTPREAYRDWQTERKQWRDQGAQLRFSIDRLAARGLRQVILVDQTTREQEAAGLHTAAMVVPGLIPIDFGYAKRRYLSLERMYQVPAACGFRDRILTADDLNPAPHPFP